MVERETPACMVPMIQTRVEVEVLPTFTKICPACPVTPEVFGLLPEK